MGFLLILSIFLITNKPQCKDRFLSVVENNLLNLTQELLLKKSMFPNFLEERSKLVLNNDKQLSYEVFLISLKIAGLSLQENFFGVGINNYENFFNKKIAYIKNISTQSKLLNKQDGSNNFAKIVVEFGIFGILLYFWIFKIILKINTTNPLEIFLIICVASQSIRGVGYFTASFIFMIATLYILKTNENKNEN